MITLSASRGADVNQTDYKGMTPLKAARRYGQEEIEAMLVEKGAQLEVETPKVKVAGDDVQPPWKVRISSARIEARKAESEN